MAEKYKILIADDDRFAHKLVALCLSPDEFETIHAYDGQETMDLIESERPDLVVLDIIMPFKDGRDICKDLKNNPKTRDIKILMLSGKDEQFDRIVGLELGADDYETKPFDSTRLANKIRSMCKKNCRVGTIYSLKIREKQ